MIQPKAWGVVAAVACGLMAGCSTGSASRTSVQGIAGAGFTTIDKDLLGCAPGSLNGINCNHYACTGPSDGLDAKDLVYLNGGPIASGLRAGQYFWAVLAPGAQNGGAADGAEGNLSDDFDTIANRTFTVTSTSTLSYSGTHALGETPNGQTAIRVGPFADTPNPGGVYILAICPIVDGVPMTAARWCKFDAFKVDSCPAVSDAGPDAPPDAKPPEDGKKDDDAGHVDNGDKEKKDDFVSHASE